MDYTLLTVVCGLAAGMIGMERWASWRLRVAQRPKKQPATPTVSVAEPFVIIGDPIEG